MSSLGLVLSICFGDSRNSPPFSFFFGSLQRPISSLRRLSLTSIPAFELVGLAICIPCSASAIRMASSDQRSNHSALHRCRPALDAPSRRLPQKTYFLLDNLGLESPACPSITPLLSHRLQGSNSGCAWVADFARLCPILPS